MEGVYNEFFLLKYHGNWSLQESYNLPVGLRRWFLRRLERQFQDEQEAAEEARNKSK